jgi:hypothetical protein
MFVRLATTPSGDVRSARAYVFQIAANRLRDRSVAVQEQPRG